MDVRSLTQTEAQERAALVSVYAYDIQVDLTDLPTGPEVRCTSTVAFTCRTPGATTFLDCAAEVLSATLNGEPLDPPAEGRITLPGLAERNRLVVESVQRDTTDGPGVHKAVDPADGEVYLWTSFEPDEARFVWACFDQPDLKAPWRITVTAPSAWRVLSNCGDETVEEVQGGRRWSFPPTPPLSSYNPVVLAGPFHELRREAGDHDLGILARRSLAAVLERDADELFTVTGQGLAFFAEQFGMPFPQGKYDQVFVPELGGAMENYGCVTWSDAFLRRAEPTPAELELLAKVLLHEMAHMWFGNIVTMRWWDDLWLNEAFAEFAANWAAERATRFTDAWASHLADDKLDAYLTDQGPASHPIRLPIRDVDEAATIFDAITYPKGASVLQQLMTYVGEERFAAGMKGYFARHAWANTTLQDLIDALAAASGRDRDRWREGWLETAGTDRLSLAHDDQGFTLVAQGPGVPPRPQVLAVGAYRSTPDGLARVERTMVEVAGERTPVELPEGAELYLVNDDDLTFATSRPDAGSRAALFASAASLPTPIARGVAVATVWDMLVAGEATTREVVGVLCEVLRAESSDAVVEPHLTRACDAAELWSPAEDRPALLAQVAATCRELVEIGPRRQVALRGLARTAGDVDELARLEGAAGDDADLRWRVLVRRAELGSVPPAEVEALTDRDPDPDSWVRALAVRAATPDAAVKEEVWRTLLGRTVPVGSVGQVATAFWRPGQGEVLRPFVERYVEALPRLHEGGMIPAMVYSVRLFPMVGIEAADVDRIERASHDAAPVVRKEVVERADLVRRMLRARSGVTSGRGR
jgi:aminopeptidase N